jgi:hypothetical protein
MNDVKTFSFDRLTSEDVEEINGIIKTIAARWNSQLFSRDYEDIVQDLWEKVLSTLKRKDIDKPLLWKICRDAVKDMIDYDQRRNHMSLDNDNTSTDDSNDFFVQALQDKGDYLPDLMIKDLFNQYKKGTPERLFLDFYGNASGAYPNDDAVPADGKYNEENLAKMLGFPSHASSRYRKFRSKMRDEISEFLDCNYGI